MQTQQKFKNSKRAPNYDIVKKLTNLFLSFQYEPRGAFLHGTFKKNLLVFAL